MPRHLVYWALLASAVTAPLSSASFIRGDVDASGGISISDPIRLLGYLFLGHPTTMECHSALDADDSGSSNASDAIYLLHHLFLGTSPPLAPFPECGPDPTPNGTRCAAFGACPSDCEIQADSIAKESSLVGSCSAVLRFDYLSRELLGWQLICGKYDHADEVEARSRAEKDTGYGEGRSLMLNDPAAEDLYVFYESPGDFGGASVVSVRTGLTLFGGAIIWDGAGEITYPQEWRSPESLGEDCEPIEGGPIFRTFDLVGGQARLDPELVKELIERVRHTPLAEGFSRSGYVFDAAVLSYPRSVGSFDPSTAEWIVIVNAGWLE